MQGYATCAASYAKDIPHDLKRTVLKTVKGHKQAWSDLPAKLIETGSSPRGAGQGESNQVKPLKTHLTCFRQRHSGNDDHHSSC
jgi:hypothetical protein